VTRRPAAAASLPPNDLPGLDPAWSRLVSAPWGEREHTWHLLDTWADRDAEAPEQPRLTYLCVHGNPTWSYLWRSLAAAADPRDRVIAVDQLGMGFSERSGEQHCYADRVNQLGALTDALGLHGPVVTVGHDWGGAISLGWALQHRDQLRGVVLTNTAVAQPDGASTPPLISLAKSRALLGASTVATPAFLAGTLRLAHPALPADVRDAYRAPYRGAARRSAIGDFVADIPLSPDDASYDALRAVADGLPTLADIPALLLWGPRDPVFAQRYLRDLQRRLPQAQVHRFEGAGHLVVEDAPVAQTVVSWVDATLTNAPAARQIDLTLTTSPSRPLWAAIDERRADDAPAVVECGGAGRVVTWRSLATVVDALAGGLAAHDVRPGDRVALLVPPGADLTALVYACWKAGAVIVVADAGLGLTGLRRALYGAHADVVVGIPKALAAARLMGLTGRYVVAGGASRAVARALGATTVADLARSGAQQPLPVPPGADDEAAVLFTSGATGPAKGVVYRHRQLQAQRDLLTKQYSLRADDRLVAAFAPFALYGPALGIGSAVPDMDVTAPGTLSAAALADAVAGIDASLVFASPAALQNVVATRSALNAQQEEDLAQVRLLLSAGAPVPAELLRTSSELLGDADAHTPYGMTEALPVCDVTLTEIEKAGLDNGVYVGHPLVDVEIALAPLDAQGRPSADVDTAAERTGEICVRAAHVRDRYDQLWATNAASSVPAGWHRTGDVGHLDADGGLWVEGRLVHVVVTADGVVTPVGPERRIEQLAEITKAAIVGVGPVGAQQVVAVITTPSKSRGVVADAMTSEQVRSAAGLDLAAVLVRDQLPVDIRHNSKIDRSALAVWASTVLAGRGTPQ
jgi:acyl-coenzyme A synthetase/AMP-(fatty) acid ligase/pimeloyl-ACP methyl ester carboxylesterase